RRWKDRLRLPRSASCRRLRSKAEYSVSLRPPCCSPAKAVSVVIGRGPYLSSEDGVADDRIEQHQREDEEPLAPEHEGEAGMRRRSFLDRDRERDHVRPERDCQSAERGRENERDH